MGRCGFGGLVDGPATLQSMSPDRVTIQVSGPGDLVMRVRATSHWSVEPGGCATSTDDGWTVLRNLPLGHRHPDAVARGNALPQLNRLAPRVARVQCDV